MNQKIANFTFSCDVLMKFGFICKLLKSSNQKQLSEVFCKESCSQKLRKLYRITPVLESLFNKLQSFSPATKERVQHRCFPLRLAKYLRITFFKEHLCFCEVIRTSFLFKLFNFNLSWIWNFLKFCYFTCISDFCK